MDTNVIFYLQKTQTHRRYSVLLKNIVKKKNNPSNMEYRQIK